MKTDPDLNRMMKSGKRLLKANDPQIFLDERPFWQNALFFGLLVVVVFIGSCAVASKPVHASELPGMPGKQAILAIIGEAENQGYQGMLAVACAIRNRGTLKGVYGLNAPRVKQHKYSDATYKLAQKAWYASFRQDITNGATHWENIKAFGKPSWSNKMIETYRIKDHVFYREIKV